MRVTHEGFELPGGRAEVGTILSLRERRGHLRRLWRGVIMINGLGRNPTEEDAVAGENRSPLKSKDSHHEGPRSAKLGSPNSNVNRQFT